MPIFDSGSINVSALTVPDLYILRVTPRELLLNGVPSNVLGVVGTASWGPVNRPVIVGGMAAFEAAFGPLKARKHDLGTIVATASLQGATDFRVVRVTDGTDVAASGSGPTGCIAFTARHTGSLGNSISIRLSPGTRTNTWRAVVGGLPGVQAEVFDSVPGAGNEFWVNLADAILVGTGLERGPSELVSAVAGAGTTAPAAGTFSLSGGTDGVAGVDASELVGSDGPTRTGIYALRGQRCALGVVADLDDDATATTVAAFGASEGIYFVLTGPANESIASAVASKRTVGLDSYAAKRLLGDYLYWPDTVNQSVRLVSPQGFVAGRLAALSPEQSSLNKALVGVVGSQRLGRAGSGQSLAYSTAELSELALAKVDVVTNPAPGGAYWAVRLGCNSSTDPRVGGDNYSRMWNYTSRTLNEFMGRFVGEVVTSDALRAIRASLESPLASMVRAGMLGSVDGSSPYLVVCDATNNPNAELAKGVVRADVSVRLSPINERFIVGLELGQGVRTVTVRRS